MSTLSDKVVASILAGDWSVQKCITLAHSAIYTYSLNGLSLEFVQYNEFVPGGAGTVVCGAIWANKQEKEALCAAHKALLEAKAKAAVISSRNAFKEVFK